MGDLTDQVRDSCRAVVADARLVAVDEEALDRLAGELLSTPAPPTGVALGTPAPGHDAEATVALVVALDAVNFGSGWHDVVRKRHGLSGARTMAAGLRDHAARTGPLTAARLRAMTPAGCAAVFGQDLDGPAGDLMELFASSLSELGTVVDERYDGAFLHLVEEAAGSAVALATSLAQLASYRDRAELDGRDVHFYKRAQITAADLAREVPLVAGCRFGDLARLTAFADNLVPHVLRVDGVLTYDPGPGGRHRRRGPARPWVPGRGRDPGRRRRRGRAAPVPVGGGTPRLAGHGPRPLPVAPRRWRPVQGGAPAPGPVALLLTALSY